METALKQSGMNIHQDWHKMKTLKSITIFLLAVSAANGDSLDRFIDALCIVESSGNHLAVGDNGKAFGILQIHSIMIRDYNRITGERLEHKAAFDPKTARKVCRTVLLHYEGEAVAGGNWEACARLWNGGPGWRKKKHLTDGYWAKVGRELK